MFEILSYSDGLVKSVFSMANAKYYGSGLCIAPIPDELEGVLKLVVLGNITLFDYVKNMSKIKRGEIIDHHEFIN